MNVNVNVCHCLSVLLRMRNISDKSCVENQNTHFVIIFSQRCAVYEIMWKNIVEPDRPQMTVLCAHNAYSITKATNTHSEYVILTAFPLQHGCTNAPQCYVIRTRTVLSPFNPELGGGTFLQYIVTPLASHP